jgi:hypothetical protein
MLWQMICSGGTGALAGFLGGRIVRLAHKGQQRRDRAEADEVRRYIRSDLGGN